MSNEAMKQALEALEHGLDYAKGEQFENAQRFKGYEHLAPDDTHSIQLIETAIKALEEALAKQEKEYPFGVYNAEDLDKAWKSGYDNCKAQAVWTLEDVKNAWKRGYASAKKECRAKEAKEKP